ncbi:hypothetical protein [Neorhizobium galegae]|uniref:Uncharacterized protein n=1 Tax=Neorhizobium galegae bv. officinalis TaxID=323656 RepID=A0A0T7GYM2_NEOGA|nr:hypothetical protein [Neorhizobium galegae]CDZ52346.1 Hypothetical protein NGAL_HAMBI1189_44390 [Neorhizobium galegae bv. officinalis]
MEPETANIKSAKAPTTREPAINRRSLLTGIAAASASVAVVATPSPAKSAAASNAENPELLQAHAELLAARAEHEQAKAALEWLVAEWRHLWPLAPEDLLAGANAHSPYGSGGNPERDIASRFLLRDTSVLTKRFNAKRRAKAEETCFHVITSEDAQERLASWKKCTPTGRTEKSLARHRAHREDMIRKYRGLIPVAKAYEAEIARLRVASGVDAAKDRIWNTEVKVDRAASKISRIPAFTPAGLAIKGEVLAGNPVFASAIGDLGFFGDAARFIQSVLDMVGRA